jgi:5-carboxymethyl-2-hydroxymuconic-semialdehyde dehydrogenase
VVEEAEVPAGVFNVVQGFGETAGAALSAHPGVDLICFTGETTTGQTIIAAGAPTLKRSSIELGGKSPVVVFEDADPELCVDAALAQIFTMNGQRCTAGSRLLVQESLYPSFVEAVAERARHVEVGPPTDPRTELGPLIRPEHHERVLGFIASAREQGARVLAGGERPKHLPVGNYLEATVIADVDEHMRVFQEEIFGPVVSVTTFRDTDHALEIANDTVYGLGAGVWTRDANTAYRLGRGIQAGRVWVNNYHAYPAHAAFGGYKQSGIGRETHKMMLDHYQQTKNVLVSYSPRPLGFF